MVRFLVGMASTAVLALQLTTPSFAQSDSPDPRTELLLNRLESLLTPPSEPRAVVSRTFAIRVKTTVTVASSPAPPHNLMCQVSLNHFTTSFLSYFETKGKRYAMPATGGSFLCDITINAKWLNADDTRSVSINVVIRPVIKRIATLPNQEEYAVNRSSTVTLPPIPLPAQNQTVTVLTALNL